MGKKNKKHNNDKKRKNDSGKQGAAPKERLPQKIKENAADTTELADQTDPQTETHTALSVSEDQINIEKVFTTLHVTPDKAVEAVVAPEQPINTEVVEQEAFEENKDEEEDVEVRSVDEADAAPQEMRTRKLSEQTVMSSHSSRGSVADNAEIETTFYLWEKKDEEVTYSRANFIREYNTKFAHFLNAIDPEYRFAAGIGPCESFDSDSFRLLLEKFKEKNIQKAWPFEDKFHATAEELRQLFTDIMDKVKFCMSLACAERGYSFTHIKRNTSSISSVWGDKIDPVQELKTLEVIIRELKTVIDKLELESEDSSRFWKDIDEYFNNILPALLALDSDTLASKCIIDSLSTVYGRKGHGFDISEEEVDQMLELSFITDGYGDFPTTVLFCPSVFTTIKQLKLIVLQLEKMAEVTDIRVKFAGVQAITRIVGGLDSESLTKLIDDMDKEPKISMRKIFAFEPELFEVVKGRYVKRTDYFKIFYTALGEKEEDHDFSADHIASALLCFYLIFPAYEVNLILFKIISSREKDHMYLDKDRKIITKALNKLPLEMRERIEVGEEFATGEITDNQDSMYYQVKSVIDKKRMEVEQLNLFLSACIEKPIISVERVFRMCMKLIETGVNQQIAVTTLSLLLRPHYKKMVISAKFFEDLLLLALSKYSLPDEKWLESKFKFLDIAFRIVNEFKTEASLEFNEQAVMDKWVDLGQHWFSMLYLSCRYPVLQLSTLKIEYPWLSANVWDEKDTNPADPKKYTVLAKVSLAWPECTDMNIIQKLILELVPHQVNRCDLYKAMKEYVSGQNISEYWKKNLLKKYDDKINFLTTQKTKTETTEILNEEKVEEENTDNTEVIVQEEEEPSVVEISDNNEEVEEDLEQVESSSEVAETTEAAETTDTVATDDQQKENEEKEQEKEQIENENTKSEVEKQDEVAKKRIPLAERTDFIRKYDENTWNNFPQQIRDEVIRQRRLEGY